MDIVIRTINFKSFQSLEEFAIRHLEKHFGRYSFISSGKLFLKKNESGIPSYNAKLAMRLKKGGEIFAEASADKYDKALLLITGKIKRQINKYKNAHYGSRI